MEENLNVIQPGALERKKNWGVWICSIHYEGGHIWIMTAMNVWPVKSKTYHWLQGRGDGKSLHKVKQHPYKLDKEMLTLPGGNLAAKPVKTSTSPLVYDNIISLWIMTTKCIPCILEQKNWTLELLQHSNYWISKAVFPNLESCTTTNLGCRELRADPT